jgi:hypothetical protein
MKPDRDNEPPYHERPSVQDSSRIAGWCFIACVVLMVLAALGLIGCATTWDKTADSATELRWVVAPKDVIQSFPGCEGALACAVRFTRPVCVPDELPARPPVCVVFTEQPKRMLAGYVISHEARHCRGEDHP